MTKQDFNELRKQADQGDHNAKILVDRIIRKMPMQNGKPIHIEEEGGR